MLKFKDDALQRKHGRELEQRFSKLTNKYSKLFEGDTEITETISDLESILLLGEKVYWSLKRNKNGKIIGFKP